MSNPISVPRALAVMTAVFLTACAGEKRPAEEVFTVRMLSSQRLSGRWERAAERGLGLIASEFDADVSRLRVDDPEGARSRLTGLGRAGVDLVFCVGACSERIVYTEAAAWPKTVFVMLPGTVSAPNVGGIQFLPEEAGYVAGAAVGAIAAGDHVGLLLGEGQPWLEILEDGFVAGFRSRRRRGVVEKADGPNGVRELVSRGVDIALYACDRADPEVMATAREVGLLLVATDPEMMDAEPDLVVLAVDVDVPEAMLRVAREVRDGTFAGRVYSFDLGSGVLDVRLNRNLDSELLGPATAALELARSEVTAGLVEFDELGL